MAKERVQKFAQKSSTQKKRSKIAPPPIDEQLQADSVSSPKVNTKGIPSKEQRDAIKRKLFNAGATEGWVDTAIPQPLANPIQTKLTIGEPGDKYEQEADRVASLIVKQINTPTQKPSTQSQPVQRQELSEENEELQRKPAVQLQASAGGMTASAELESAIQQARSGGQPLADNIREPMEQAFGADFSRVKIHTDSQADQLNRATQARAFATGQDVFFRSGEYNPGSREGQELLAHELTHVVQQNGGAVQRSHQPQAQLPQHPVTETSSESVGDCLIQGKFAGALEGITIDKLKEILPSYGITDESDVQKIEANFDKLKNHPLDIVSVPQLVARVLGKNLDTMAAEVKKDLIDKAGAKVGEEAETVTLKRGDTRTREQIKEAGGFFGRDHAPITIEHARQIMQDWQSCTPKQKLDKAQAWKAQTKGKTDIVPYVATGEESQKGGTNYEIQVPMTFRGNEGDPAFTPKLGCDRWPIESATIMAIKMHGGEVVFLTGIPYKFIKP